MNVHLVDKLTITQVFDHCEEIVSVSSEANHEAALEIMLKKVLKITTCAWSRWLPILVLHILIV